MSKRVAGMATKGNKQENNASPRQKWRNNDKEKSEQVEESVQHKDNFKLPIRNYGNVNRKTLIFENKEEAEPKGKKINRRNSM
jgi:hypothetical protein